MSEIEGCCERSKSTDIECCECFRALCVWHSALSPVDFCGEIVLVDVCMPRCDAEFWKKRTQEFDL